MTQDWMICKNCKYFLSYQDEYEDDLEPDDCGTCLDPNRIEIDNDVIDDDSCEHFKSKGE